MHCYAFDPSRLVATYGIVFGQGRVTFVNDINCILLEKLIDSFLWFVVVVGCCVFVVRVIGVCALVLSFSLCDRFWFADPKSELGTKESETSAHSS